MHLCNHEYRILIAGLRRLFIGLTFRTWNIRLPLKSGGNIHLILGRALRIPIRVLLAICSPEQLQYFSCKCHHYFVSNWDGDCRDFELMFRFCIGISQFSAFSYEWPVIIRIFSYMANPYEDSHSVSLIQQLCNDSDGHVIIEIPFDLNTNHRHTCDAWNRHFSFTHSTTYCAKWLAAKWLILPINLFIKHTLQKIVSNSEQ